MDKKALITGATGFIGSSLVRKLLSDGWAVDVITRPSSNLKSLEGVMSDISVYEFSGKTDALLKLMKQSNPDVVFHVASLFLSSHTPSQVVDLINSNVLFGSQLLEAMANSDVRYFVNTSTSWEHYENQAYNPVNLYAATKKSFADILQYYTVAGGIQSVTLEIFDTYGSNDWRPKLLNLLMTAGLSGSSLSMSLGEQQLDLVHINDVVSAYVCAADRLLEGDMCHNYEVFGVASGRTVSLKQLVGLIEQALERKVNIEWGGRPYRNREVMVPFDQYDCLPSWQTRIELEQGLQMLKDYKRNLA